jgi:hypothetical protein
MLKGLRHYSTSSCVPHLSCSNIIVVNCHFRSIPHLVQVGAKHFPPALDYS